MAETVKKTAAKTAKTSRGVAPASRAASAVTTAAAATKPRNDGRAGAVRESSAATATGEAKKSAKTAAKADAKYVPRLKKLYQEKFAKELQTELNLANINLVPKLAKIIVSVGTGRNRDNKAFQATVANTLAKITGQHPTTRLAKKSIATFKIRKNMGAPVGTLVTLRGEKMWEFLDRLVNVAMPRIRDFHGVSRKAFDKQGNYNLGIAEQSIFAELSFEETATLHGLEVTFAISHGSPDGSRKLLEKFGMPFEKEGK